MECKSPQHPNSGHEDKGGNITPSLRKRGLELPIFMAKNGVNDGIRTRDRSDHNRELYQLSYAHHFLMYSDLQIRGRF